MVQYSDNFLNDGSVLNKSIVYLTCARNNFRWSGPILASSHDDLNMKDVSALAHFFIDTYNGSPEHSSRKGGQKVNAVKVTCEGEQRLRGQPPYKAVMIPRHHPVFETGIAASQIGERVGLPLKLWKYRAHKNFEEPLDGQNPAAASMMNNVEHEIDPDEEWDPENDTGSFGLPPRMWWTPIPSVLVARKDRNPIDAEVVEAFVAYCQFHVHACSHGAAELAYEEGIEKRVPVQATLAEVTAHKWTEYLTQWRILKKHKADGAQSDVVTEDTINGVARMGLTSKDAGRVMDSLMRALWSQRHKKPKSSARTEGDVKVEDDDMKMQDVVKKEGDAETKGKTQV